MPKSIAGNIAKVDGGLLLGRGLSADRPCERQRSNPDEGYGSRSLDCFAAALPRNDGRAKSHRHATIVRLSAAFRACGETQRVAFSVPATAHGRGANCLEIGSLPAHRPGLPIG